MQAMQAVDKGFMASQQNMRMLDEKALKDEMERCERVAHLDFFNEFVKNIEAVKEQIEKHYTGNMSEDFMDYSLARYAYGLCDIDFKNPYYQLDLVERALSKVLGASRAGFAISCVPHGVNAAGAEFLKKMEELGKRKSIEHNFQDMLDKYNPESLHV